MDIRVIFLACLCLVVRVQGATYDETCATTPDCTGADANLVCLNTKCACTANYAWDTEATTAACKLSPDQACTGTDAAPCVSHTVCTNNMCKCTTGYRAVNGLCAATYDSACTADGDCTPSLINAKCTNSMCKCADGYKANTATPKACSPIIGMTCTADADCNVMGISKAECSGTPKMCKCMYGYDGVTCPKIYNTKTCSIDGDCSALKHSRCSGGKCQCATTAVAEENVCKLKIDQACPNVGDLCPMHATCKGTPKKCACDDNYETSEDKCKLTNSGMTVTVSVLLMVAALFSVFLH